MHISADNWTRAERTFGEVVSGMGEFLQLHHQTLKECSRTVSRARMPTAGRILVRF